MVVSAAIGDQRKRGLWRLMTLLELKYKLDIIRNLILKPRTA